MKVKIEGHWDGLTSHLPPGSSYAVMEGNFAPYTGASRLTLVDVTRGVILDSFAFNNCSSESVGSGGPDSGANADSGSWSGPWSNTQSAVKLKAVKRKSKLRVNVNPNRRAWNYKIKVQKKRRGKWKTVKVTYTKGRKDVRTINRHKGKYRIKVPRQHGLKGSKSKAVRLKR